MAKRRKILICGVLWTIWFEKLLPRSYKLPHEDASLVGGRRTDYLVHGCMNKNLREPLQPNRTDEGCSRD